MPRCCDPPNAEDTRPCYASVLLLGHARDTDEDLRRVEGELCPCVTTWCARCKAISLITTDAAAFPSRAAHHVHYLALSQKLRERSARMIL